MLIPLSLLDIRENFTIPKPRTQPRQAKKDAPPGADNTWRGGGSLLNQPTGPQDDFTTSSCRAQDKEDDFLWNETSKMW
jgi:hypothetical protein